MSLFYDIWVNIIDFLPFFDSLNKRLVCCDFNQLVLKRIQKLENSVSAKLNLAISGFKNDWRFHIIFNKCVNCDSIRAYFKHDLIVDFDFVCPDNIHSSWNHHVYEIDYVDGCVYFKGGSNIYKFCHNKFQIVYKQAKECELVQFIFAQSEIWQVQMNYDKSMKIMKPDGTQMKITGAIMNPSEFPDPSFNQLNAKGSKNALVFEGFDNDCDTYFIHYINFAQKTAYHIDVGKDEGATVICWTDQMLLFETNHYLVKFFPIGEILRIKNKNATIRGVLIYPLFSLFTSDNDDVLFCSQTEPCLQRFSEMKCVLNIFCIVNSQVISIE